MMAVEELLQRKDECVLRLQQLISAGPFDRKRGKKLNEWNE